MLPTPSPALDTRPTPYQNQQRQPGRLYATACGLVLATSGYPLYLATVVFADDCGLHPDASHIVACEYDREPVTAHLSDRPAITLLLGLSHRAQDQVQGLSAGRTSSHTADRPAAPATSEGPLRPHVTTPLAEDH